MGWSPNLPLLARAVNPSKRCRPWKLLRPKSVGASRAHTASANWRLGTPRRCTAPLGAAANDEGAVSQLTRISLCYRAERSEEIAAGVQGHPSFPADRLWIAPRAMGTMDFPLAPKESDS